MSEQAKTHADLHNHKTENYKTTGMRTALAERCLSEMFDKENRDGNDDVHTKLQFSLRHVVITNINASAAFHIQSL